MNLNQTINNENGSTLGYETLIIQDYDHSYFPKKNAKKEVCDVGEVSAVVTHTNTNKRRSKSISKISSSSSSSRRSKKTVKNDTKSRCRSSKTTTTKLKKHRSRALSSSSSSSLSVKHHNSDSSSDSDNEENGFDECVLDEDDEIIESNTKKYKTYEVSKIIDDRTTKKGSTEYKVRWKGFSSAADTWEPESSLMKCPEALEQYIISKNNKSSKDEVSEAVSNEITTTAHLSSSKSSYFKNNDRLIKKGIY